MIMERSFVAILHRAFIRGEAQKRILPWFLPVMNLPMEEILLHQTLQQQKIKASFFFTGRFYNNPAFKKIIQRLKKDGHYSWPSFQ